MSFISHFILISLIFCIYIRGYESKANSFRLERVTPWVTPRVTPWVTPYQEGTQTGNSHLNGYSEKASSVGYIVWLIVLHGVLIIGLGGTDIFNEPVYGCAGTVSHSYNLEQNLYLLYKIPCIIMLLTTSIYLIICHPSTHKETSFFILFCNAGLIMTLETQNLLGIYIGLELYSLSAYILASGKPQRLLPDGKEKRYTASSIEQGLKYFLLSALSSGIYLGGVAMVYGAYGSFDLTIIQMGLCFDSYKVGLLGLMLICGSFLFKLGSAPFHFWVPDVYSGIGILQNFFFITIPKVALLFILIKLVIIVPHFSTSESDVLGILLIIASLLSIGVGTIGALMQKKIRRLLAFSSISHVGYILLGILSYRHSYNYFIEGLASHPREDIYYLHKSSIYVLFYIIIYIIMSINIYSILYVYKYNLSIFIPDSSTQNKKALAMGTGEYLWDYKGIGSINPFLAGGLAICCLSLGGVPPLAGFIAKQNLFIGVLDSNYGALALYAIIMSAASAIFYLRIIRFCYFHKAVEPVGLPAYSSTDKGKGTKTAPALVISFLSLFLAMYPALAPNLVFYLLSIHP